ncbi:MAG: polysaccharide export protein [Methylococcales bacterium]|nr:polysaccharide export protein [Methylococcales bacterium]
MLKKTQLFFLFFFFSQASFAIDRAQEAYHLGAGDILKINVFNQEELSGEYTISGSGFVSLPLIGSIETQDITLLELKQRIVNQLKPDYLLNPRISIEILNYRPFYILGEVKEPKSYPYVDGMSYLNAIAISGGYTYRAKKDYVMVIHANSINKRAVKLGMDNKVKPGDVIRVKERFF